MADEKEVNENTNVTQEQLQDVKMKYVGLVEKENFSHTRKYAAFAQTREKLITKMQMDFAALQQNVARFFRAA